MPLDDADKRRRKTSPKVKKSVKGQLEEVKTDSFRGETDDSERSQDPISSLALLDL